MAARCGAAIVAQDQHKTMGIKPIETRAYGHRFRSRLEARWAVAFTEARIAWQYEPEGFDLGDAGFYLPDFWLPQVITLGKRGMWAEVKPDRPTHQELRKVAELVNQSGHPCLLLIGLPAARAYWAVEPGISNGLYGDIDDSMSVESSWEVLCGGVATLSMDYSLFEKDPDSFYVCCGCGAGTFPMPIEWGADPHPAIEAALSARFEHGESPR